ncbi:hypothetical protein QTH90_04385 [Variovorax sp. J2P1-59]|uniref:hypothetical protein n=1 Tax=Variovorax flavidus TaxID=3053501 RepID=UPI0025772E2A|nr:hypothetical protein [Variovorax sp. J2P1-59]MDM0073604.1 hypothetical protein [Variovorax sp. J2P1-59]
MPLAMPQPDFEPSLVRHLSAFRVPVMVEAVPHPAIRSAGPGDEDEDADPVGIEEKFSARQLLMVYSDRR